MKVGKVGLHQPVGRAKKAPPAGTKGTWEASTKWFIRQVTLPLVGERCRAGSVAGAGEHRHAAPLGTQGWAAYLSSTHVSLVPPPWLEFTTSEPSFSATRVSPPGTIRTSSAPDSTNGRKSTWRGATPEATKVGQVERASVGWAMKPSGAWRSFRENSSSSRLVACGPTSIP